MAGIIDTLLGGPAQRPALASTVTPKSEAQLTLDTLPLVTDTSAYDAVVDVAPAAAEVEITKSGTRQNSSPQIERIQQAQSELFKARENNALAQMSLKDKDAEIRDAFAQEEVNAAESFQLELDTLQDQARQEYDRRWGDIEAKQQELERLSPKTFWQKADTADKIGMSLGILLGSLGQGLSGSRSNAAIEAMNTAIDRDLQQQYRNIDNKMKLLDQSRIGLKEKQAMFQQLEEEKFARHQAALGQLDRQLNKALLMTKSEDAKLKIGEELTKINEKRLETQLAFQKELAGTSAESAKGMSQGDISRSNAFNIVGSNGAPARLSVSQAQPNYVNMAVTTRDAFKRLEDLERQMTPAEWNGLQATIKKFNDSATLYDTPVAGNILEYVMSKGGVNPQTDLSKVSQRAREYFDLANRVSQANIRAKSGAAISPQEFVMEFRAQFPTSPEPTAKEVTDKAMYRRDIFKAAQILAKDPNAAWFERAKASK